jgi:hypothetical protein
MNGDFEDSPFSSGNEYMREAPGPQPQQTAKARPGTRETAWRLFSTEFNGTSLEIKPTEEKMPSYVVTPLGAKVNRVLVAGVLTEIEDRGSEDEHMWVCRVQDPSGNFYVNAGRFQPEASAAMASLVAPCLVAAVGKVRLFRREDGNISMSVRPERVVQIDEKAYSEWILETAKTTWSRLKNMRRACGMPDATVDTLVSMGVCPAEAEGIIYALDNAEPPSSEVYLRSIQNAIRKLLPDEEIDLGIPGDAPDEVYVPGGGFSAPRKSEPVAGSASTEDAIMRLLEELDVDGRGAPRDELERRAESMGISSIELEEVSNSLMEKGLIYEPSLKFLKII